MTLKARKLLYIAISQCKKNDQEFFEYQITNYSIEIWHLIQREMKSIKPNSTDIIQFDLSLEELRAVTGTQDKLKQMVHFKDKCFDKALREIYDNCGVNITYQNIRIGRKIVGFRCTAVSAVHKERARQGKERIRNSQKRLEAIAMQDYGFDYADELATKKKACKK